MAAACMDGMTPKGRGTLRARGAESEEASREQIRAIPPFCDNSQKFPIFVGALHSTCIRTTFDVLYLQVWEVFWTHFGVHHSDSLCHE